MLLLMHVPSCVSVDALSVTFVTQNFVATENHIQSNLDNSNTDGLFTMANSNSLLSPYEILPIAPENKYLGKIFLFYHGIVCCVYSLELSHQCDSNKHIQQTIIV